MRPLINQDIPKANSIKDSKIKVEYVKQSKLAQTGVKTINNNMRYPQVL